MAAFELLNASETLLQLQKGAFLCTGSPANPMTIGWGSLSVYWGKPVFIVPVRHSRHSFTLLNSLPEFTISVPCAGEMAKALAFCGSHSGRDASKWQPAAIAEAPSRLLSVPIVAGCKTYYECRVLYTQDLSLAELPPEIRSSCYPKEDAHRLYFGEILAQYEK